MNIGLVSIADPELILFVGSRLILAPPHGVF